MTPRLPTGHAYPVAYTVTCPKCEAPMICPSSGSHMIGRDSVDASPGGTTTCFECGTVYKLPAIVLRLGR